MVVVEEILRGEEPGLGPHQADDHDVHPSEPVHRQLQPGEQREGNGGIRPQESDQKGEGQGHQASGHGGPLSLFPGEIGGKGHDHGEENK